MCWNRDVHFGCVCVSEIYLLKDTLLLPLVLHKVLSATYSILMIEELDYKVSAITILLSDIVFYKQTGHK